MLIKWAKFDFLAFLEGVDELTAEERGFYITLICKLYARAPREVTDNLIIENMKCRPQVWRRVKAELIRKEKVQEVDGSLMANGVEAALAEAIANLHQTSTKPPPNLDKQAHVSAGFEEVSSLASNEIKDLGPPTTTSRITKKDARAREAISNDSKASEGSLFVEGRPRHSQHDSAGRVYLTVDKPEWRAWTEHSRRHGGNGYPNDANFGWWFPTRWPPDHPDVLETSGQPSKQANGRPT